MSERDEGQGSNPRFSQLKGSFLDFLLDVRTFSPNTARAYGCDLDVSLFDNYYEWDGAESSFAGVDKRYHAGNDTLIMRDLSREQVVMQLSGDDLEIGIKEEGKAFSGLSDVLTIKN